MTPDVTIESHDDDSVTLTVGTVVAKIRGANWREANDAATVLGQSLASRLQIRQIYSRLSAVRGALRDLEDNLARCDHSVDALLEYIEPTPHKVGS